MQAQIYIPACKAFILASLVLFLNYDAHPTSIRRGWRSSLYATINSVFLHMGLAWILKAVEM
jgi:hypothetical protein